MAKKFFFFIDIKVKILIEKLKRTVKIVKLLNSSSSSFGKVSTPGQTQTGLGPRVYPLVPQTVALPESDAGSDVIKPASSFVIQNCQTSCSMWCPMYRARC